MLKNHDFYKYKIKKRLMTPKILKKATIKAGFKILKFEGVLFEISNTNQNLNSTFDRFIKTFKLNYLFKNLSSVLVFKLQKK